MTIYNLFEKYYWKLNKSQYGKKKLQKKIYRVILWKSCSEKHAKFTGKYIEWSTFITKIIYRRCFIINKFTKFERLFLILENSTNLVNWISLGEINALTFTCIMIKMTKHTIKFHGVHAARFVKRVWPFFIIMHERAKRISTLRER